MWRGDSEGVDVCRWNRGSGIAGQLEQSIDIQLIKKQLGW